MSDDRGVESQVSADSTRFQGTPSASDPSRERLDRSATPLSFADLTVANFVRCQRWHPGFPHDGKWTGADWSNAACGEVGEAANVVKKMRRVETGTAPGPDDPSYEELRSMLADEIADAITYLDLLATFYGINVPAALISKFNRVSERQGFPDRLRVS